MRRNVRFRDVRRDYHGPARAGEIGPRVRLRDAQQFRFSRYADPVYPPLADAARIQGAVALELSVDADSGTVTAANAVSGHMLLAPAAVRAAMQWRFVPPVARTVTVVVEFALGCE